MSFFHPRFHSWRHLSLLHWEITLSGKIRTTYRWKARKNPPFQKIRCQKIDQKIPTKREYDRFHLPLYPNPSKFNLYSCRNVEHENGQFFSPYNCRKCTLEHYSRLSRRCCRSLLGKILEVMDTYSTVVIIIIGLSMFFGCFFYYRNRKMNRKARKGLFSYLSKVPFSLHPLRTFYESHPMLYLIFDVSDFHTLFFLLCLKVKNAHLNRSRLILKF